MGNTKADLTLQQQGTRAKIQGYIASSGASWAHVIVWKKVDMYVVKVEKDPLWECTYVPIVTDGYFS